MKPAVSIKAETRHHCLMAVGGVQTGLGGYDEMKPGQASLVSVAKPTERKLRLHCLPAWAWSAVPLYIS